MRRFLLLVAISILSLTLNFSWLTHALAAGSIGAYGGGNFVTGETFTISVVAGGATFDSLQGAISVSGVADIVGFSAGGATWLPGKSPSNGGQFVGLTSATSSLTVATITLSSSAVGSGAVSVSGVRLAYSGDEVGTGGGTAYYNISRAPTPPGTVVVSSSTHPNQNKFYGRTTVQLAWKAPANGADGYAVVFDKKKTTVPVTKITTTKRTVTYTKVELGTHYFHIRSTNADGWGPTTTFRVNVKEQLNDNLAVPIITGLEKLPAFATNVENGTVSGFKMFGNQPVLTGYELELAFDPEGRIPEKQKTSVLVAADGSWEIVFNSQIPSGFYEVTAVAKKITTITPQSEPLNIELSVANGGEAKVISADDLPKPDLTVTVAGVTFATKQQLWKVVVAGAVALLMIAVLGYAASIYFRRWQRRKISKNDDDSPKPSNRATLR